MAVTQSDASWEEEESLGFIGVKTMIPLPQVVMRAGMPRHGASSGSDEKGGENTGRQPTWRNSESGVGQNSVHKDASWTCSREDKSLGPSF